MSKTGKIIKCAYCSKEFYCSPFRLKSSVICCSRECASAYKIKHNPNKEVCPICGKIFNVKPSYKNKTKQQCCSRECLGELRKTIYLGENNPNYGNRGKSNPNWKSDKKITNYGYVKIRCLDHPFKDCDGFVFEHRLVAERYLLNEENSVEIDGKRYLSKEYVVHHINHNRQDNRVENLIVLKLSEHTQMHMKGLI